MPAGQRYRGNAIIGCILQVYVRIPHCVCIHIRAINGIGPISHCQLEIAAINIDGSVRDDAIFRVVIPLESYRVYRFVLLTIHVCAELIALNWQLESIISPILGDTVLVQIGPVGIAHIDGDLVNTVRAMCHTDSRIRLPYKDP